MRRRATMRDTLGGDLATVPGHKARRRQGAAAVPPHQIVSPSLSQSELPVAVDLRICGVEFDASSGHAADRQGDVAPFLSPALHHPPGAA